MWLFFYCLAWLLGFEITISSHCCHHHNRPSQFNWGWLSTTFCLLGRTRKGPEKNLDICIWYDIEVFYTGDHFQHGSLESRIDYICTFKERDISSVKSLNCFVPLRIYRACLKIEILIDMYIIFHWTIDFYRLDGHGWKIFIVLVFNE